MGAGLRLEIRKEGNGPVTQVRISSPEDVPAQRALWKLAFGDGDDYIDNFYHTYYRPERMLVLEEAGRVCSMTAWFDTAFVVPERGEFRCAYLYAVATHPDCRGKGLAGRLLAGADDYFRSQGIPAVSTVPAEPSLHDFFGRNGFRECFRHFEGTLTPGELPPARAPVLRRSAPAEYGRVRETLLTGVPHIAYAEDALRYQEGCCALGEGGLYVGDTSAGPVCLCAEEAGGGLVVIKEYLGSPAACRLALPDLHRIAPAERWLIRSQRSPEESPANQSLGLFGMLKWLDPKLEQGWDWASTAYLGLAFD